MLSKKSTMLEYQPNYGKFITLLTSLSYFLIPYSSKLVLPSEFILQDT